MKTTYVKRETLVHSFPLATGVSILHPELATVKFGTHPTLDVGILCYMNRAMPNFDGNLNLNQKFRRKADLESLSSNRVETVRNLLAFINEKSASSVNRPATLYGNFKHFCAFINWSDAHGWPDVLRDIEQAMPALYAYLDYIEDRVARNLIGERCGASAQSIVVALLSELFDTPIGRGLNLLSPKRLDLGTTPPSEYDQGRVISLCRSLFDGVCDFVLSGAPFPYALSVPGYLNFSNNQLWIFPTNTWFKTPQRIASDKTHAGWNFAEGRLATIAELKAQYTGSYHYSNATRKAKALLDRANFDAHDVTRKHIAMQAFNAFTILFLSETAMNWAQAKELRWSDDYQVLPTKQGFRTIKWRASGKVVSFELSISFLPLFKRFIQLRSFCKPANELDYLFFSKKRYANDGSQILSSVHKTYLMLRRIDPTLSRVMPREWRAAKSDWLIRNKDISTASLVLQTSENTLIRHYAKGSESVHREEMSAFFSKMASAVISPNDSQGVIDLSLGKCTTFGKPQSVLITSQIKSDCVRSEGCLFCDKFKVHADETDTRKLLSGRSVIKMIAPLSESEESYQDILEPILSRIDSIISEIAVSSPEMVVKIQQEVEIEGDLDPYWAGKAEMLIMLGLI